MKKIVLLSLLIFLVPIISNARAGVGVSTGKIELGANVFLGTTYNLPSFFIFPPTLHRYLEEKYPHCIGEEIKPLSEEQSRKLQEYWDEKYQK